MFLLVTPSDWLFLDIRVSRILMKVYHRFKNSRKACCLEQVMLCLLLVDISILKEINLFFATSIFVSNVIDVVVSLWLTWNIFHVFSFVSIFALNRRKFV